MHHLGAPLLHRKGVDGSSLFEGLPETTEAAAKGFCPRRTLWSTALAGGSPPASSGGSAPEQGLRRVRSAGEILRQRLAGLPLLLRCPRQRPGECVIEQRPVNVER